jgi:serine/threonine-protein kinase RsbW
VVKKYETSFFSEIYNVKTAINNILRFIIDCAPQTKTEELSDLRLILSELMCNCVIHGNKQDLSKKVRIAIEIDGQLLTAVITDEGDGFDYCALMKKEGAVNLSSDHGRGLNLVFALTDSAKFNPEGNQIKITKRMMRNG